MIRDGLEAGSVADVVDLADQGAGSEATRQRWLVDWAGLAGGALIGAGVVLELVYTFLVYPDVVAGAGQLALLLQTVPLLVAQVVSAGLVVGGSWPTAAPEWPDSRSRRRVRGGLFGACLSVLYLVNSLVGLGAVAAGLIPEGPYFLFGETLCLPFVAGSAISLARKGGLASVGRPGRATRADALPLALVAITVAGALVTSLPAWVVCTFTGSTGPHSEELTPSYTAPWVQFGGPWAAIAVSVGQMVVVFAMAVAAALWRPARFGTVILTGVVLSLITTAIQGICSVTKTPPRAFFGIPDGERMAVSVSGTPWLWAFCGFTGALIVELGWLFARSRPRPRPAAVPVTWTEPATPGPADDPPLP